MKALHKIICPGVADLDLAANEILNVFGENRVFAFYGSMGAGKTTFIQRFCKLLGVNEKVSSPTFAIVQVYAGRSGEIYHFDFYRIAKEEEIFDIGYEDYFFSDNYCFIEWPEKIERFLPEKSVRIDIVVDPESGARIISF